LKAICVTPSRELEVRDVPELGDPPPGHLLVRVEAAAINHGDKTFLKRPGAAGPALARSGHDVWGASAAGEVTASGPGVPEGYVGRRVAIYRSLSPAPYTVGLWCEHAQISWTACLRLPDEATPHDYSGSLVNLITAQAFMATAVADGHRAILATAGSSATSRALAVLARRRGMPMLLLVRSEAARSELERFGSFEVLRVGGADEGLDQVASRAAKVRATAVFDGVGGGALGRLLPHLAQGSTVYAYGFLAGPEPVSFPSSLLMTKDLTLRRFSNFETSTVRDPVRLRQALRALEQQAHDPLFTTRVGRTFSFEDIDAAMAYEGRSGAKAVLVPT
jgi:NADPH:quinone reductase